MSAPAFTPQRLAVDVFSDGEGLLGLPVPPFRRIFKLIGCQLDPIEGMPALWRYEDAAHGRTGVVLNVAGLLNGGAMHIGTRGWVYEAEHEGRYQGLYLPSTN